MRTERQKQAKKFLEDLYRQKQADGLLAIYLWGSILTNDYNPQTSDIDAIGIISPNASEDNFITSKDGLAELKAPPRMGFRVIYQDEFEKGTPRSWMGKVIHPRLLLADFPRWVHVAGQKFERSDFPIADLAPEDIIRYRLEEIRSRHYDFSELSSKQYYYFCKSLFRLCYNLHQLNHRYDFSYSNVATFATDSITAPVVEALTRIRQKNWDIKEFEKHQKLFAQFMAERVEEYA